MRAPRPLRGSHAQAFSTSSTIAVLDSPVLSKFYAIWHRTLHVCRNWRKSETKNFWPKIDNFPRSGPAEIARFWWFQFVSEIWACYTSLCSSWQDKSIPGSFNDFLRSGSLVESPSPCRGLERKLLALLVPVPF